MTPKKQNTRLIILLFILTIIFFLLGAKFKGLVVVTTVNGEPIYSWQFLNRLYKLYGSVALEEIILEKLILAEASKHQVTVGASELSSEMDKIKKETGGYSKLEAELEKQGLSYKQFTERVKISLLIGKILDKKIKIGDREIEAYIRLNLSQLEATTEADRKEEAKEKLKIQRKNELYDTLFQELKAETEIQKFINF